MQALTWAARGTLFTFGMTALGAAAVFFFPGGQTPRPSRAMPGFAAGVMTAASVWSLLLPAMEQAAQSSLPPWLPAAAGVAAGAVFLFAADAWFARRQRAPHGTALLMTAVTLHNIPEGMAVGLACALGAQNGNPAAAAALAVGIAIQNFPEGAAISLPMREDGNSRRQAFLHGALSGIVEPLFGVPVVFAAAAATPMMPWLLSFAAGAMLYASAAELLPRAQGHTGAAAFLAGFLIMMTLDVALG